jgi:ligand-binding sensor domain-containing protein
MYNRNEGKIKRIEGSRNNLSRPVVTKIKSSLNKEFIITASPQLFFKINLSGKTTDSISFSFRFTGPAGSITDFIEYEEDQFIITSTSGLFQFNWKSKTIKELTLPAAASKDLRCIEKDADGKYWIGSSNNLIVLAPDFSFMENTALNNTLLKNCSINDIQKDPEGRIWLGANTGLFLKDDNQLHKVIVSANEPLPLNISSLFIDIKGTVWVTTVDNGLYQVYQPDIFFQTLPGIEIYSKKNKIQSILEEKPGTWLIGTMSGIVRYEFAEQRFEKVKFTNSKEDIPVSYQLKDKNNGWWIGTNTHGLFYQPAGQKEFLNFSNQPGNANFIASNNVVALKEDKFNNIWIGTYSPGNKANCLYYYDSRLKKINPVTSSISATKKFDATTTSQIETDELNRLWVGTWDKGLFGSQLSDSELQQNMFSNYSEASAGKHKISHNVVSCVKPGRNGKIWFGTVSGGLNMLDTKTDSISWFTIKNGMPGNLIYRIEEDDQGILWMSTDNGISRYDPATNSFINYNTSSGLPTNNFTFLSSVKIADGSIAFGTNDGQVVYFNPNSYKNTANTQPVVITDIRVFNKSLETGSSSVLKKSAYLTDTISLNYDQSVISFELANLDFLNPEVYTYAYKLEGFDKNWTYMSERNSITYTNLNPGTYTLLIKNANHFGTWNEIPTKIVLIIKPPFWWTWWFISLIILAIASFLYALFRYRLHQKLRVLQIRNRLHRDLHDDIGATLSSVKAYSEILKDNPDNPLIAELIRDNSAEMIERLEVIAWATNPQHDNFKSLKNRMIKFAAPLCHSKNIQCDIESEGLNEEVLIPGEIRQNIFLVFKEAMNNMMKYAEATACSTSMFIQHNRFVMQIKDNGKGFEGAVKESGNGLKNMQKRTEELNGKFYVESSAVIGTVVSIRIPYPFKIPNSWDRNKH